MIVKNNTVGRNLVRTNPDNAFPLLSNGLSPPLLQTILNFDKQKLTAVLGVIAYGAFA